MNEQACWQNVVMRTIDCWITTSTMHCKKDNDALQYDIQLAISHTRKALLREGSDILLVLNVGTSTRGLSACNDVQQGYTNCCARCDCWPLLFLESHIYIGIFYRFVLVNPSLSSSVHCTDLRLFACCCPRCAVRSQMHLRLQIILSTFVLVRISNLNTTAIKVLNKHTLSECGCSNDKLLCVRDEHSFSIKGSVLTNCELLKITPV